MTVPVCFFSERTCAHLDLKENQKYHTFSTFKGTSSSAFISVGLHYEEFCIDPTSPNDEIFL